VIGLRLEGGKELAAALNSLPARVRKSTLTEVLKDAAEPMRKSMAKNAPRAEGAPDIADNMVISSVRSIKGEEGTFKTDEFSAAVAVGPSKGFHYGFFLEFGTVKMSARSFARPAFDSNAAKALKDIGRRLWVELAGRGVSRTGTSTGPTVGGPGGETL